MTTPDSEVISDLFLQEIVGTDERRAKLEDTLVDRVISRGFRLVEDPYTGLYNATFGNFTSRYSTVLEAFSVGRDPIQAYDAVKHVQHNSSVGFQHVVRGLKTVDRILRSTGGNVERQVAVDSATATTRHILKLAFSDQDTALGYLDDLRHGTNPLLKPVRRLRTDHHFMPNLFETCPVTRITRPGLPIKSNQENERGCPAIKSVTNEGRSSLFTIGDIITNVAVDYIFPRHFEIVEHAPLDVDSSRHHGM